MNYTNNSIRLVAKLECILKMIQENNNRIERLKKQSLLEFMLISKRVVSLEDRVKIKSRLSSYYNRTLIKLTREAMIEMEPVNNY